MDFLLNTITHYGLVFVFLVVLIEQLGAPIPAYPVLMLAGALAARGEFSIAALFTVAVIATLMADNIWYFAGQRLGRRVLRLLCAISLTPDNCVRQTEAIFVRFGPASLAVAKFVPGFASVATALSGALHIRRATFLLFDTIGSALWVGVGLALGWLFSSAIEDVVATLGALGKWGLGLILIALALFVAAKWWQRRQFQMQLKMQRITVEAMADLIDRGEGPVVVDVRSASALPQPRIPGALHVHGDVLPAELDAVSRDALVVVYCACPNEASAVMVAQKLARRGFRNVLPLLGGIDAWEQAGRAVEHAQAIDQTGRAINPA